MNDNSKTIVFIHGLSENSYAWKEWIDYFENLGYTCFAPDYPFHTGTPEELRKETDQRLGSINLSNVLIHYFTFLDSISVKQPILIGHSMGGLIVQKLMEMEKGSMGICITSAPPNGITTFKCSFFKSNLPTINPLKGNTLFYRSKKWFYYSIANTLSREESDLAFEKVFVPESRNIPRSSTGITGKVNFKKAHKPLLFIGAEKDHIIPIVLNKKNYKAYEDKNSITDFKAFSDRSHYICGQEGWEEVAEYIFNWIQNQAPIIP